MKFITALGIFLTALFTFDNALGGAASNKIAEVISGSDVLNPVVDYISVLGTGVVNAFSHFDLFSLFSRDNIAFFVGVWALILISRLISSFTKV